MEIQNLSPAPLTVNPIMSPKPKSSSAPIFLIIIVLGITTGFWFSRFSHQGANKSSNSIFKQNGTSTENVTTIEIGKIYGNQSKAFKDTATGTIEKGSINGEGTHILNRDGGKAQRAALNSSSVDLDLFIGKKVEIKGETNASTKVGWLLDVGVIKVLE